MKLKHYRHCTYLLTYHLILVVKYRKKCIDQDIAGCIKDSAALVLSQNGGQLLEFNTDKDHVHMIIELGPKQPIGKLIGVIKGVSSRRVRSQYANRIRNDLWGDSFWSDSYFIASCGGVTLDVLKQYVEKQGQPRKRGRPRRNSSQP